ncbi:two-component system connector SafA [Escherichia coli]|nr:two-component system connector SafA [Escherichia coli]MBL6573579.1 two-component system connector SafA [Escherichia coli]
MHATTVKNKITQRDNYKEIMSAIAQLSISEMGRIARDLTHFIINSLQG